MSLPAAVIPTERRQATIQSVDRAAQILVALSGGVRRLGVTELSVRLGLSKATIHGLLRTLRAHGLVEQDSETEKYQLGPALLALSNSYLGSNELRARSLVWSELLSARTGETVRVGIPHDDGALVVHHVFRQDQSLQILEVGAVLPLHASALGKAMLAYMGPDVLKGLVARGRLLKLTAHTLSAPSALRRDLEAVRARRYALEREEAILGEAGIAAAVFDRDGYLTGAIGVVGPRQSLLRKDRLTGLTDAVVEAARGISRDLGAMRWPMGD